MAKPRTQDHAAPGIEEVGMYATRSEDRGTPSKRHGHQNEVHHTERKNVRPIQSMRASDKGFSIIAGRPRKKPWEQKATIVLRFEQETYQRIRRLAAKRRCSVSQAAELLIRTQESEKIEPTLPVDYSHLMNKHATYTVSQILNEPLK